MLHVKETNLYDRFACECFSRAEHMTIKSAGFFSTENKQVSTTLCMRKSGVSNKIVSLHVALRLEMCEVILSWESIYTENS